MTFEVSSEDLSCVFECVCVCVYVCVWHRSLFFSLRWVSVLQSEHGGDESDLRMENYRVDRYTKKLETAHIQSSLTQKLQSLSLSHTLTLTHTHTHPQKHVWKWLWSVKLLHCWEVSTVRLCVSFLRRQQPHSDAAGCVVVCAQQQSGRICAFT